MPQARQLQPAEGGTVSGAEGIAIMAVFVVLAIVLGTISERFRPRRPRLIRRASEEKKK